MYDDDPFITEIVKREMIHREIMDTGIYNIGVYGNDLAKAQAIELMKVHAESRKEN